MEKDSTGSCSLKIDLGIVHFKIDWGCSGTIFIRYTKLYLALTLWFSNLWTEQSVGLKCYYMYYN